jgi:galactose-1-phosphate uridylyltransferase
LVARSHVAPEFALRGTSAGHAADTPSHCSLTSQNTLAYDRQMTAAGRGEHTPSAWPVSLFEHAWQSVGSSPPHAVSQQRLSTQNPLSHCAAVVQTPPVKPTLVMSRVSTRVVLSRRLS